MNDPGTNFFWVDGWGLSLVVQDVRGGVGVVVVVPTWWFRDGVVRYFFLGVAEFTTGHALPVVYVCVNMSELVTDMSRASPTNFSKLGV